MFLSSNLFIKNETQSYKEQPYRQNLNQYDFRNIWWVNGGYYSSIKEGITPYNVLKSRIGISSFYFYGDSVWVLYPNENWKTKCIKKTETEYDILSPSGDGNIDYSVKIQKDSLETFLQIYDRYIKNWKRFKKYPQKYSFKNPPAGLINDVFFVGKYKRIDSLGSEMEFTLDGKITGFKNYTDYSVGYGFPPNYDCVSFANIDSINKYKGRYHPNVYHSFHWKVKKDTLELYSLIPAPDFDEIGPLSMKLLRISR